MGLTKWFQRWLNQSGNKPLGGGIRRWGKRVHLLCELLEDRLAPATNITVITGAAGAGNLDHFLDATHGTIASTDDPGDTAATLSVGALQGVNAATPISITADSTIHFNNIGTLNLQTGGGVNAAFLTNTGTIDFAQVANTVNSSGGSQTFSAGSNLTVANLNTSGGDVALTAAGDICFTGISAAGQTVTITSTAGAILDCDSGETEPANPTGDFTNGASVDIAATNLALSASTGVGITSGMGVGPLEAQVANLEADTSTGGIFITNGVTSAVTLNVGGLSGTDVLTPDGVVVTGASGDVQLINNGGINIVVTDDVVSGPGNVTIQAVGAGADIQTGVQAVFNAIRANGNVSVSAGRDILLGNGSGYGSIGSASGAINVGAGRDLIVDFASIIAVDSGSGDITAKAGRNITVQQTNFTNSSRITNSGSGKINLTTGVGDVFTLDSGEGGVALTALGDITISADDMVINNPITTSAKGIVTLQQASTTARNIDVGLGTMPGALGLSDAELEQVYATVLRIGRTDNAGNISVTAPVTTHTGFDTLDLRSGGSISQTSGSSITVANLALTGANGIGSVAQALQIAVANLTAGTTGTNMFLFETGTATVTAAGLHAGAGKITLGGGTFLLAGHQITAATTTLKGTARLLGPGTVAGSLIGQSAGSLAAGSSSAPGTLITGPLALQAGFNFGANIHGFGPGQFDQLVVTGGVNLGGANLNLMVGSVFVQPLSGSVIVLIRNSSNTAVVGQFAGLPNNSIIVVGGHTFRISYFGGPGNDVVLKARRRIGPGFGR